MNANHHNQVIKVHVNAQHYTTLKMKKRQINHFDFFFLPILSLCLTGTKCTPAPPSDTIIWLLVCVKFL